MWTASRAGNGRQPSHSPCAGALGVAVIPHQGAAPPQLERAAAVRPRLQPVGQRRQGGSGQPAMAILRMSCSAEQQRFVGQPRSPGRGGAHHFGPQHHALLQLRAAAAAGVVSGDGAAGAGVVCAARRQHHDAGQWHAPCQFMACCLLVKPQASSPRKPAICRTCTLADRLACPACQAVAAAGMAATAHAPAAAATGNHCRSRIHCWKHSCCCSCCCRRCRRCRRCQRRRRSLIRATGEPCTR